MSFVFTQPKTTTNSLLLTKGKKKVCRRKACPYRASSGGDHSATLRCMVHRMNAIRRADGKFDRRFSRTWGPY